MKNLSLVLLIVICSSTFAQEPPPAPEPTEHHKKLARDVGEWTANMKMWMAPDADPMTMPASEKNTLMDGGMFVLSEFESGPFKGRGIFGYDPRLKKYTGTWIDNNSPHMSIMQGTIEDDGKMVMYHKGYDPVTGKEQKLKNVTVFNDDNSKTFTMYRQDAGSQEWVRVFVIEYKRK